MSMKLKYALFLKINVYLHARIRLRCDQSECNRAIIGLVNSTLGYWIFLWHEPPILTLLQTKRNPSSSSHLSLTAVVPLSGKWTPQHQQTAQAHLEQHNKATKKLSHPPYLPDSTSVKHPEAPCTTGPNNEFPNITRHPLRSYVHTQTDHCLDSTTGT